MAPAVLEARGERSHALEHEQRVAEVDEYEPADRPDPSPKVTAGVGTETFSL